MSSKVPPPSGKKPISQGRPMASTKKPPPSHGASKGHEKAPTRAKDRTDKRPARHANFAAGMGKTHDGTLGDAPSMLRALAAHAGEAAKSPSALNAPPYGGQGPFQGTMPAGDAFGPAGNAAPGPGPAPPEPTQGAGPGGPGPGGP